MARGSRFRPSNKKELMNESSSYSQERKTNSRCGAAPKEIYISECVIMLTKMFKTTNVVLFVHMLYVAIKYVQIVPRSWPNHRCILKRWNGVLVVVGGGAVMKRGGLLLWSLSSHNVRPGVKRQVEIPHYFFIELSETNEKHWWASLSRASTGPLQRRVRADLSPCSSISH